MSNGLATMNTALATVESHDFLTQEKIDLIKRTVFPNATDLELEMFLNLANTKRLDPLTNQIYAIKYGSEKASMFASIDGLRIIAQRTGEYGGQTAPYWCGPDLVWREVWLEDAPPAAAKVGVWKRGYEHPTWGVATWKSYAFDRKGNPKGNNWRSMPEVMLSKCAESLALRKAFPDDLSGLYVRDEFSSEDHEPGQYKNARGVLSAEPIEAEVVTADPETGDMADFVDVEEMRRTLWVAAQEMGYDWAHFNKVRREKKLPELETMSDWQCEQMFNALETHPTRPAAKEVEEVLIEA